MKILVLDGNPLPSSFCGALAEQATEGATAVGHEVRQVWLSAMQFDSHLSHADPHQHLLEPNLEDLWQAILWAERIILIHPLWWGAAPAKLKGLFDRVLRSRMAFNYQNTNPLPEGLLKGRTAEVIITSDTPTWFFQLGYRWAWPSILKRQILGFCGIKVTKIRNFGPMRSASEKQRMAFLSKARALGSKG